MEQAAERWVAGAASLPRQAADGARARVKKRYGPLQKRHGPRFTGAMLAAALLGQLLPVPGSSLLAVVLVVAIA